jgi:hypothetical protein
MRFRVLRRFDHRLEQKASVNNCEILYANSHCQKYCQKYLFFVKKFFFQQIVKYTSLLSNRDNRTNI